MTELNKEEFHHKCPFCNNSISEQEAFIHHWRKKYFNLSNKYTKLILKTRKLKQK